MVHPFERLDASFFYSMVRNAELTRNALKFAAESLLQYKTIEAEILATLLARPETSKIIQRAVKDGKLDLQCLPPDNPRLSGKSTPLLTAG